MTSNPVQPGSSSVDSLPVSYAEVVAAAQRIAGIAHRTPAISCAAVNERGSRFGPRKFFFKGENLQKVGAFKFRGAMNAVAQLNDDQLKAGVVTHSSGNHAQAIALAARICGAPAWIVMPTTSNPVKREAVIGYGAEVIDCEPTQIARETTAAEVQQRTGATMIHPYNHPHIIAGQGTAALELVDQVADLDLIIAPVGGGGLISGTCIVARKHGIDVMGAEPTGADDAARSKAAGKIIPQTSPNTIADGLLTSLGDLTWPYVRDVVKRIVTVDDPVTIEVMRFFFQRSKYLIEPSSAVAVAAA
ncbi:MAG: pyridoxal-phosphate dependent enzyme, partial [Pirellulaceae bacterium]